MQVQQVTMQAIATPGASVRPSGSQVADSPLPGGQAAPQAADARPARATGHQPSEAEVRKAVERANAQVAELNENIRFGFSDAAGMLYVQVVDQSSGEVIRQIPSKEFLAAQAAAKAEAAKATGLLLNRQG